MVKFARIEWIPTVITNPDGSQETLWYVRGSVTDDSKKMSITDALFQIIQETIRVGNLRYTKEINLNANQSVGLAGPVKINTAYSPTVVNTTEIGNDGRDTIVAGNQLKLKGLGIIQVIGGGHGSDIEVQGLSLKLTENTPLTLVDDTGSVTLTAAKLRRLLALVE